MIGPAVNTGSDPGRPSETWSSAITLEDMLKEGKTRS
jgi:hypothetical protein